MPQMCPNCSRDNPDNAHTCAHCHEPLLGLRGYNTMLEGRYRVTHVLGCGGMGAVYLADDTRIQGRRVAVKENLNTSPQAQSQFQSEASLMVGLRHPGLPTISDQFIGSSGRQYLVMDYIAGETLEDIVKRRGPLPETEVRALVEQLLDILEYLHSHSIIHRDVKPANTKLMPSGKLVLVDFGIAKQHAPGLPTQTWARGIGSPGFAPIEQYGTGTDARSDLYSLGAVTYYLLTGHVPPEAPDRVAGTSLTPLRKLQPGVSAHVERVVLKAMELYPADRYQSAAEMYQALLAAAGSATSTSLSQSSSATTTPVATPTLQRKFGWSAVSLLLIAVVVLLGSMLLSSVWRSGTPSLPTSTVVPALGMAVDTVTPEAETPSLVPTGVLPVVVPATDTATSKSGVPLSPAPTSPPPEPAVPSPMPPPDPSGKLALVRRSSGGNLEIFVMNLEDGQERQVTTTPNGGWSWAPAWSPNGRLIAFSSSASGRQEVHIVPASGGSSTRVTNTPNEGRSGHPTWSPDSQSLIFQSNRDGIWQLYRSNLAGTNTERLTGGEPPKYLPAWSPAGQEIVFTSQAGDMWRIFKLEIKTQQATQLGDGPYHDYAPSWSPDGNWIAFQTDEGRAAHHNEIYIMDRQGKSRRRLTFTPEDKWSRAPTWSPDGQWLAFVSNQDESIGDDFGDIYLVHVHDGEVRRLTFGGTVYDWRVSWTVP